ncbi:uncharacterized protein CBL_06050 [Carabus blaptoides fortunei]
MANKSENSDKTLLPHHVQQELCTTRPLYRQGRKLTAVKVYTINNESQHLLIFQVPKINLSNELRNACSKPRFSLNVTMLSISEYNQHA